MNIGEDTKMLGVPEGVSYGQNEHVDELNNRMVSRQFPDRALQPNFDFRPESTKYALFPIMDKKPTYNKIEQTNMEYMQKTNFNPGTKNAPPSGYFSNIDTETILRNQTIALQHGANQGVYVPTSESELYKVHVNTTDKRPQPHTQLFNVPQFSNSLHPNLQDTNIGKETFYNHTRTQLRNSE